MNKTIQFLRGIVLICVLPCTQKTIAQSNTCAGATSLTLVSGSVCISGTTAGATQDLMGTAYCTTGGGGGVEDNDVWYTFTTPAGSPSCWTFNMTRGTAVGDMMMRLFKSCYVPVGNAGVPSAGSSYVCDDGNYLDISSAAFTPADWTASTTYYLQVDTRGASAAEGTFSLCIKSNVNQATNDQCSGPIAINTTSLATDNASSGCEYSYVAAQDANVTPAQVCAGSLENVSWYAFTALNTGSQIVITIANIDCNGGGGGFQSGLLKGTCATYTALTCAAGTSGTLTYSISGASVVAGQTYLIAMDGNAGSNCHFNISGTNLAPLPIELLYFNSVLNGNAVDLSWSTATEINNDYYTIERSSDGVNFDALTNIKGAGTSLNKLNYFYRDSKPLKGVSYYRLKQTDYDFKKTYSAITSITIDNDEKFDFILFPNPSGENDNTFLQFVGMEDEEVAISVIDISGKELSSKKLKLTNSGTTTIELKHQFDRGIYFIKAINKKGIVINQKLLIK